MRASAPFGRCEPPRRRRSYCIVTVKNLKTRPGYLDSLGQDLGIVAPAQPASDPQTTRPAVKLVLGAGDHVEVQIKKQGFPGARLEVDRGNGLWVLLAIITSPHYVDTVTPAPGTAAVWKYRAIYLQGDQPFGQWSDTATIAVQG